MQYTNKNSVRAQHGFTLVELLITIGIIAMIAVAAVPQFTASQNRNNLRSTFSEIQSLIKVARNYGLTGRESTTDQLPTGGYGVYFTTTDPEVTPFIDDGEPPNYFLDAGEFATGDVLVFNTNVEIYELRARASDGCRELLDAAVVYTPPRSDAVLTARTDAVTYLPASQLDSLWIALHIVGSTDPLDIRILEISTTTGRLDPNPDVCDLVP